MNKTRVLAIARKELFHLLRDRLNLAVALALPVIVVSTLGAAIEFNVQDLRLAISDQDKTSSSRKVIDTFTSSGYFIADYVSSPADAISEIEAEHARAALIIDSEFEKHLKDGRGSHAQVLIDGSDSSTIGPIQGYVSSIEALATRKLVGGSALPQVSLKTRYFHNPELRSRWFIVPGVGVVVLAILSVLLTSLTVAKEWEAGSMELLLSTPARPTEIIIGKILPYLGLGFVALVFVYLIARVGFGVPFRGSHLVYILGTFLFLMACFSQGILISVANPIQQVAMQQALTSGLMPALLLSGFIFSVRNMPAIFHFITSVLGVRWFMEVSRLSYLRETTLAGLAVPLLALAVISATMVGLAIKNFKTDLEPKKVK